MGLSYRNVVLRKPAQSDVTAYLTQHNWRCVVSPTVESITVVYPERFISHFEPTVNDGLEDQLPMRFVELVIELSRELHCIALAIDVADDDFFRYLLADSGVIADYYVSPALYPTPETAELPLNEIVIERVRSPRGGKALLLCQKFSALEKVSEVAAILSENSLESKYFLESRRHRDLVDALGFPDIAHLEVISARGKLGFISL